MGRKLYVGNLGYEVSSADLQQIFPPHGTVDSAQVIMDRDTNRSKGFGFVEMSSDQEAKAAIGALDGQTHGTRALKVNEAKPARESQWRWRLRRWWRKSLLGRRRVQSKKGHLGGLCFVLRYDLSSRINPLRVDPFSISSRRTTR